jgi:hypothetical protein
MESLMLHQFINLHMSQFLNHKLIVRGCDERVEPRRSLMRDLEVVVDGVEGY